MARMITQTTIKICLGTLLMRRLGQLSGAVQCKRNGWKDEWTRCSLLSAATVQPESGLFTASS